MRGFPHATREALEILGGGCGELGWFTHVVSVWRAPCICKSTELSGWSCNQGMPSPARSPEKHTCRSSTVDRNFVSSEVSVLPFTTGVFWATSALLWTPILARILFFLPCVLGAWERSGLRIHSLRRCECFADLLNRVF